MHTIHLSSAVFGRLQAHAVPLEDTPETVISRALDALDISKSVNLKSSKTLTHEFDGGSPPDLLHTTPYRIVVGKSALPKGQTYWNSLMIAVLREGTKNGATLQELKNLLIIPYVSGEKFDHGYKYYPDLGLSIQGQDSNGAWRQTYHAATSLKIELQVIFQWQSKDGAAFPGKSGIFTIRNT